MEIEIHDKKLAAALDADALQKVYGKDMAKSIDLRLTTLDGALALSDFWPPGMKPERVHALKGDLKGTFSVDLRHPFRLLFVPLDEPTPIPEDQLERWKHIKKIKVTGIEDTHG